MATSSVDEDKTTIKYHAHSGSSSISSPNDDDDEDDVMSSLSPSVGLAVVAVQLMDCCRQAVMLASESLTLA